MATQPQSTPQIFISHSGEDNRFALQLASDLRKELGQDKAVWIDRDGGLRGGDDWEREIIKQIATRNIFIVVLSPGAMESKWVNFEVDFAWKQKLQSGKRVLPIRYTLDTFKVRKDLAGVHEIDFRPPRPPEEALTELLARCQKIEPEAIEDRKSRREFVAITASTIGVMTLPGALSILGFLQKRSSDAVVSQTPFHSSSGTPGNIDADPPPSAFPATPLLYQADWSRGLDGWSAPGWTSGDMVCNPNQARKGLLFCDWNNIGDPGLGSWSNMFAPFFSTTANYAVEVEIQVIESLPRSAVSYGILVKWSLNPLGTVGGYVAGIGGLSLLKTPFFNVVAASQSSTKVEKNGADNEYKPGKSWHRYRVEAKKNTITFYIDNQKIFAETSNVFSDGGQVGLLCSGCRLNVRNFKVIGL
jgi:hypothetical protein